MDITPQIPKGLQVIQSYGNQRFSVNDVVYENGIIIMPHHTEEWLLPDCWTDEALDPLLKAREAFDLLILGFKSPLPYESLMSVKKRWHDVDISVDAMNTGAACRTYNVLLTEGRKVAAAITAI